MKFLHNRYETWEYNGIFLKKFIMFTIITSEVECD